MTKIMKLWTCPDCGSTDIGQDAYVNANDGDDVSSFDDMHCHECDYDGRRFEEVEVDVEGTDNEYLFGHLTNAEKLDAIRKLIENPSWDPITDRELMEILNK